MARIRPSKSKTIDMRRKGIVSTIISKDILVPLAHLTNIEIADITGYSKHIVKKSLAHHGLYKGKVFTITCPTCENTFDSFNKKTIFCSNDCKHNGQKIWNRGLSQTNDSRLMSFSKRMKNNSLGKLADRSKADVIKIVLPNTNITTFYDKKSNLEKEWLLLVDKEPGIVDIKRSDLVLKYSDDFNEHDYYPDFEITWITGVRWLVEIKGLLTDTDYQKFEAANDWCRDNGYQYRLITTGSIKREIWTNVYSHPKNIKVPSLEWVLMNWAVTAAALSTSPRRSVGAIIASKDLDSILSYGYNGDERGGINCPTCTDAGKDGFIHAEENAIIKLASKEPCKLFVTMSPCIGCAKRIINTGSIKEVYYLSKYRDLSGVGLLAQNGIRVYHFQLIDHKGIAYTDEQAFEELCPVGLKKQDMLWRFK